MKRAIAFLLILVFIPLVLVSVSCSRTTQIKKVTKHASGKPAPVKKITGINTIFFMSARDGSDQVYSMNPDGTGLMRITDESDGILKQGFDISKDGKKIVCYGPRGDYSAQPEMIAANVDGSGLRSLGNGTDATWSPDGKQIICLGTNEFDSVTPVRLFNQDGTGAREIASDGFAPIWSSAGDKIAYFHLTDVSESKGTSRIVNLSGQLILDFGVCYPKNYGWSFSPDDTKIAYYTWDNSSLKIGSMTTGSTTATIVENANTMPPVWSPDGSTIFYQVFPSESSSTDNEGLWFYDVKAGKNQRLMKWYSSYSKIMSWSPDGALIAISGDPSPPVSTDKAMPNPSNIWTRSKSGALTKITDSGQDYSPIWR